MVCVLLKEDITPQLERTLGIGNKLKEWLLKHSPPLYKKKEKKRKEENALNPKGKNCERNYILAPFCVIIALLDILHVIKG